MSGYVCPECGLDYDTITPADGKVAIRSFPRRYRTALADAVEEARGDDAIVRQRPAADVWSALEYTAHAADLLGASAGWIHDLVGRDRPTLTMPEGGDFAVVEGGGGSVDNVVRSLSGNSERLAGELDKVGTDDWGRTGTFPWGERDILTTMRNAVHEGSHHLRDVERVLEQVRPKR